MIKVKPGQKLSKMVRIGGLLVKLESYSPKNLADLMEAKGWDQKKLAAVSHVSQASISNYITGKSSPTDMNMKKLGKALGVLFVSDWITEAVENPVLEEENEAS